MTLKVIKEDNAPVSRIVSFRISKILLDRLKSIAAREDISTNALVKQMLEHCADECALKDTKGRKGTKK